MKIMRLLRFAWAFFAVPSLTGCGCSSDDPSAPAACVAAAGCRCGDQGYCSVGLSRKSFTNAQGKFVECNADGLLAGCMDTATCVKGTCVPKDVDSPAVVSLP